MNIIIFGATGRTGNELMLRALDAGHTVTAFVRNPSKLTVSHRHLKVEKGEATRYSDINDVMSKHKYDVVYSVLGAKGMFKRDLPLIEAMKNIVQAAEYNNAGKLIHVSFVGVHPDAGKLGLLYKYMIPTFMTNLLRDHREKDAIVTSSKLNWVLVQPPVLTSDAYNGEYIHEAKIQGDHSRKLKLSRSNLAEFMLKLAEDATYDKTAVYVTE